MRSGKVDEATFCRLGGWKTGFAARKYRRTDDEDMVKGFLAAEEFAKLQTKRRVVPGKKKESGQSGA